MKLTGKPSAAAIDYGKAMDEYENVRMSLERSENVLSSIDFSRSFLSARTGHLQNSSFQRQMVYHRNLMRL